MPSGCLNARGSGNCFGVRQFWLAALGSKGHDIVVMSGDVHYGRVVSVTLGTPQGATLYEVVSSPLLTKGGEWKKGFSAGRYGTMKEMMRRDTMLMTLIIGLMAGPAVSLNGSPTVSPVTAAL